jgi:hypothetical protein
VNLFVLAIGLLMILWWAPFSSSDGNQVVFDPLEPECFSRGKLSLQAQRLIVIVGTTVGGWDLWVL